MKLKEIKRDNLPESLIELYDSTFKRLTDHIPKEKHSGEITLHRLLQKENNTDLQSLPSMNMFAEYTCNKCNKTLIQPFHMNIPFLE